jgi:hypothetical protein
MKIRRSAVRSLSLAERGPLQDDEPLAENTTSASRAHVI